MYRHNSTIRIKQKPCSRCGRVGPIFSRGRCQNCAKIEDTMSRMEQETEQEIKEEGLQELVAECDRVFSLYIRRKAANSNGFIFCYICDKDVRWQDAQNMHYIKRGNMFLRYDERNCKAGCRECNEIKGGNYLLYSKKLEEDRPGITEILYEEGNLTYKYTRDELKQLILDFNRKLK